MIEASPLFAADPGHIVDFSGRRPAEIFNNAVLPRVNSFLDLLDSDPGGLDEGAARREQELQARAGDFLSRQSKNDAFFSQPAPQTDLGSMGISELGNYDTPTQSSTPSRSSVAPTTPSPSVAPSAEPLGAQVREAPTSKNLTDFVKHFEGFNPRVYSDFKQNSIGYGTRAKKGETRISKEEAEARLGEELGKARSQVEELSAKHGYDFTENQKDALTSFAYNVGNLNQLTARGTRDKDIIAKKILEYNKAGGKTLPGLVNRREAEHKLFTQGY